MRVVSVECLGLVAVLQEHTPPHEITLRVRTRLTLRTLVRLLWEGRLGGVQQTIDCPIGPEDSRRMSVALWKAADAKDGCGCGQVPATAARPS